MGIVQGTKRKADDLEAAVESVYHHYMPKKLAEMTDAEFKAHVQSFKQDGLTPPNSYHEEFDKYWGPVQQGGMCFNLHDEMMFMANLVTKEQLQKTFHDLMSPASGLRKKVVVKYFSGAVPARPNA